MTVAYSYIRFSSEEQALGDSLRRQLELSDNYAKANNLIIDNSLKLQDLGVSAFKKANAESGALRVFLDAIKSGKVLPGSYLLVESLDRISRATVMDALEIFTSIINAGITIVTLSDNQVYSRESIKSNWAQLIISISIMSRAHEESLMKSQRIKAAWANRKQKIADKKLIGKCPAWLEFDGDKKFKLKKDAVKIIKQIIKLSNDGVGMDRIAKTFNKEKVPCITGYPAWSLGYIQRVLENPALYGEAQFKNMEPVPNYYPAIITKEEFLAAKAQRSARRNKGGSIRKNQINNLFPGLLVCGYCGEKMWISSYSDSGTKRIYKYYICGRAKMGKGCTTTQWWVTPFEKLVLKYLSELNIQEIISEKPAETEIVRLNLERVRVDAELTDIKGRISNLVAAIASGNAPKAVIDSIIELERTSLGLSNDLQRISETIRLEESADKVMVEHTKSIVELYDLLSKKSDVELFHIRLRLQEHIRRVIKSIDMKAGGSNIEALDKNKRYATLIFRNKNVVRHVSESGVFDFSVGTLTIKD